MNAYKNLALTVVVHFFVMYALSYVMIDNVGDVHLNVNRAYMAILMVVPMVVLMLLVMRSMFQNRKLNSILYAGSAVLFAVVFVLARSQGFVDDKQFLRSMIPHHSSAILMCGKSSIRDPEVIALCGRIIESQRREIDQMENILNRIR